MKNNVGVPTLSTWLTHDYKCFFLGISQIYACLGTHAQYIMHEAYNLSSSMKHHVLVRGPPSYKIT